MSFLNSPATQVEVQIQGHSKNGQYAPLDQKIEELGREKYGHTTVEPAMLARLHDYVSSLAILPDAVSFG
jgi:hypothetical protein